MSNKENKLVVNGQEYQLIEIVDPVDPHHTPYFAFKGKAYVGQAVVKQQDNVDWDVFSFKSDGSIDSVKRLSDGEIFRIGDECYYQIGGNKTHFKIEQFKIEFSVMRLYYNSMPYCKLEKAIKVEKPKPLFQTTDGKDVYHGDEFWYVNLLFQLNRLNTGSEWVRNLLPDEKTFFFKENAEEYIIMNKPLLSVNDVIGIGTWILLESAKEDRIGYVLESHLKQLAKINSRKKL